MLRLDASLGAAAKEALDAAVAEALDHGVYLYAIQATSRPLSATYRRFQRRIGTDISMSSRNKPVDFVLLYFFELNLRAPA